MMRTLSSTSLRLTALAAVLTLGLFTPSHGEEKNWRHGLSLFGDLKYEEGFSHFDYVNPDAPKGGKLTLGSIGTFDSFNPFIVKGQSADGIGYLYETLLKNTSDEPSAEYGLLAEAVSYPADYSSVTFRLREEARWHDGKPVTVDDVIFSLETLKTYNPQVAFYYANVVKAEKTGEREVTFSFDSTGNRELPLIVGQLSILPKHWYVNEAGETIRAFNESTLEPPLGSGPYKVGAFEAGSWNEMVRVEDYWGKDLNVNKGWYNFDVIRTEYYKDTTPLLAAFKTGIIDFRAENSAKNWATEYNFPAVERGDVITATFDFNNVEAFQADVYNLRLPKFQDKRVREAFNLVYDFDWLNKNIFFEQYARTDSYFEGSEMEATGTPEGLELEILEPLRGQVPDEVFTTDFENPDNATSRQRRANLIKAKKLLEEAGYTVQNGKLVNSANEPFTVEFLYVQPSSERILNAYKQNLEQLGIDVTLRRVDAAQYTARLREKDFEIVTFLYPQSLSPGNEQRNFFGSEAADRSGSRNIGGIKDPAVDAIIERIVFAKSREELVAAAKALDRVLLWNRYHMPQFHSPVDRVAYWNVFGKPDPLPAYASTTAATLDVWWFDADKAATVNRSAR